MQFVCLVIGKILITHVKSVLYSVSQGHDLITLFAPKSTVYEQLGGSFTKSRERLLSRYTWSMFIVRVVQKLCNIELMTQISHHKARCMSLK